MEKKGKEEEIKGSSHWWRKSLSPDVVFHYRKGANLTHHSITARPGESMLDMRQEQGALPATTSKQSRSQAAQSRDTLRRRRSLSKHPRLSSGGCSWEGTVTFLIQPAAPFHSAATYVSQHVYLHLRTQFKITLLNNVNDSPPPDLFSFGIRNQHWEGEVWLLQCYDSQGGTVPPLLTIQTKHWAKSFSVKDMACNSGNNTG